MSKHESSRRQRLQGVALAAAVSATALTGCYDGGESSPRATIPAAEQARTDAEQAEHVNKLQALNIGNSSIRAEVDSGSISMAEATKATYDSVKGYVDYAQSEGLSLSYYQYYVQTGDSTTCEFNLDDDQNVTMSVRSNGSGQASYDTDMTITPEGISYHVYISNSGIKEGMVFKNGEVTSSQFADVIGIIGDVQADTLDSNSDAYCASAMHLTSVLTDKFAK